MNYLGICKLIKVDSNLDNTTSIFTGKVTPKTYNRWQYVCPEILVFEGIHQFAVKVIKSLFDNEHKKHRQENLHDSSSQRFIPVQLKNIQIQPHFEYDPFYITGYSSNAGDLFKVEFKANRENTNSSNDTSLSDSFCSGTVYVAQARVTKEPTCISKQDSK